MNHSAHVCALIDQNTGNILSIDIYSAGPGGLTHDLRNDTYAELFVTRGSSFSEARFAAKYTYETCYQKLAARFPIQDRHFSVAGTEVAVDTRKCTCRNGCKSATCDKL